MTWYVIRQGVPLHEAPIFGSQAEALDYLRTLKPELKAFVLELDDEDQP